MSDLFRFRGPESALDLLGADILAEKADALGRAGRKAEACLAALRDSDEARRDRLAQAAADAVYAYFVQRELCGLRRHDALIREMRIPRAVLARLGAKP
jgi:hypothetical protein